MRLTRLLPTVLTLLPVLLASEGLRAQEARVDIQPSDKLSASNHSNYKVHVLPTSKPRNNRASPLPASVAVMPSNDVGGASGSVPDAQNAAAVADATITAVPAPGFYPGDLSYFGGPVLQTAKSVPLYVDCDATCWNNPAKFLDNLGKSSFIHITDQYVGSTANDRYTVGAGASVPYPIFTALTDNDILTIAYAAGKVFGTGYRNIYHIFLPKGVDVCFTGEPVCYSPDNPATFDFCAYHGSVTFSDFGHVLYTVEPYQDVDGCKEADTVNFSLTDSTANVLSHETFETITDPDGSSWFSFISVGTAGEEIGDLCERIAVIDKSVFFFNPPTNLNGKNYAIQPEYSNKYHACAYAP